MLSQQLNAESAIGPNQVHSRGPQQRLFANVDCQRVALTRLQECPKSRSENGHYSPGVFSIKT
jgi:hypothetical protein